MPYFLGEMTAPEVKALYPKLDYVVLPVGSNEQHAFHLPMLSDTIQAEGIARELAAAGEKKGLKLGVLPALPFGYSEEFWNYPGTVSLKAETYLHLIMDVGACLKHHGARRMLIINGHFSNMPILDLAVDRIQRDMGLPCHLVMWTNFMKKEDADERKGEGGHSGYVETCMDMYFRGEWVKMEKLKAPHVTWNRDSTVGWWGGTYFEELTDTGALGGASRASAKAGGKIAKKVVERMIVALKRDAVVTRSRRQ